MSFTNQTTHYGLPQWIGSDKPTYLVDQNNAYQTIDSEIYNANVTAGEAVTTANGAASTAGAASATAADALSAAQTASSTADSALTAAQDAGTVAQAAQTAAGAAQTAAQAAQEAAAGNSITNLAPPYDPTITYVLDALVTEAGKLYKCIVAVDTPEQFDVNKWDDVTTSEVYARVRSGNYLIKTVKSALTYAGDSTKTIGQYIDSLSDNILNDLKAFLNVGDIAVIDRIFYKFYDFQVDSEPLIVKDTASIDLRMSAIHYANTSQVIATGYKYGNNAAAYSETTIDLSNSTITSAIKTDRKSVV